MAAMVEIDDSIPSLQLDRSIGFDGRTAQSLVYHPGGGHLLYPLGSTVVVRELGSKDQDFLTNDQQDVSCVAVSPSGRYVASGHETFMGFKADICVWDFESLTLVHRLVLHKCKVIDLAFSPNERYLVSLGGEDDNSVVVWDLESGQAICGSPASQGSSGNAHCVEFFNTRDDMFVTGGAYTLRVWTLDMSIRKILPEECNLAKQKRVITCLQVELDDEDVYCGTTTGDVLHVNLRTYLFRHSGPRNKLVKGITSLAVTAGRGLVVGSGSGVLATLTKGDLVQTASVQLAGSVTSIALMNTGDGDVFVGTADSNIYSVDYDTLEAELRATAHPTQIFDVAYPRDYSEVFATCGPNDIRLWNANTSEELIRIEVPNVNCLCVCFSSDGGTIYSGWEDGRVRAFGPETGRQLFVIENAHKRGVTAITATSDGARLVTGGSDGQVRSWRLLSSSQVMEQAMKEHKGAVTSIQMRRNDLECVTSSADGSCIIWDLQKFIRIQVMFAPSLFKAARFHPDEGQVLTVGTDRKICFWDALDGSAIRELEMPPDCSLNSIDVFAEGERFVTGGDDKCVMIWNYDEGEVMYKGEGHSSNIVKVVISPDQREVVSISSEGAIFVWKVPAFDL